MLDNGVYIHPSTRQKDMKVRLRYFAITPHGWNRAEIEVSAAQFRDTDCAFRIDMEKGGGRERERERKERGWSRTKYSVSSCPSGCARPTFQYRHFIVPSIYRTYVLAGARAHRSRSVGMKNVSFYKYCHELATWKSARFQRARVCKVRLARSEANGSVSRKGRERRTERGRFVTAAKKIHDYCAINKNTETSIDWPWKHFPLSSCLFFFPFGTANCYLATELQSLPDDVRQYSQIFSKYSENTLVHGGVEKTVRVVRFRFCEVRSAAMRVKYFYRRSMRQVECDMPGGYYKSVVHAARSLSATPFDPPLHMYN